MLMRLMTIMTMTARTTFITIIIASLLHCKSAMMMVMGATMIMMTTLMITIIIAPRSLQFGAISPHLICAYQTDVKDREERCNKDKEDK